MKALFTTSLLVFVSSACLLADPADELATKVIRSEVPGYYVKGQTGTHHAAETQPLSAADEQAFAAAMNSQHALQDFMLSDQAPKRVRLLYAIQVLRAYEQKAPLDADQAAVRAKLIELGRALQATP